MPGPWVQWVFFHLLPRYGKYFHVLRSWKWQNSNVRRKEPSRGLSKRISASQGQQWLGQSPIVESWWLWRLINFWKFSSLEESGPQVRKPLCKQEAMGNSAVRLHFCGLLRQEAVSVFMNVLPSKIYFSYKECTGSEGQDIYKNNTLSRKAALHQSTLPVKYQRWKGQRY